MDCVFCRIIAGMEGGFVVYEDEEVVAILDKYPVSRGHTLVMPKKHFENIHEIPEDTLCSVVRVVKLVSGAVAKAMNAPGIRIMQNNGSAAGQVIFHIHFHVIPMGQERLGRRELTVEEGITVSRLIKEAIASIQSPPRPKG